MLLAEKDYFFGADSIRHQLDNVSVVLHSRRLWSHNGQFVTEFEHRVADYVGAGESVAVSSATAGFELALRTLGIGPGDEVIIPEYAWVSLGGVISAIGASPRVAPVDESLSISWQSLAHILGSRTRVVMMVHMRGHVAKEIELISESLLQRGIYLIEDCAQAWGARVGGRHVGTFGVFGVFSTQQYKLIATGEGGVVVSSNTELTRRLRLLSGDTRISGAELGWCLNSRMSELHAAVALPQLEGLDKLCQRLRALQRRVLDVVAESELVLATIPTHATMESSNGISVGLWFSSPERAHSAVEALLEHGILAVRPGIGGDLQTSASWPSKVEFPLLDLATYVDIPMPDIPDILKEEFIVRVRRSAATWNGVKCGH